MYIYKQFFLHIAETDGEEQFWVYLINFKVRDDCVNELHVMS